MESCQCSWCWEFIGKEKYTRDWGAPKFAVLVSDVEDSFEWICWESAHGYTWAMQRKNEFNGSPTKQYCFKSWKKWSRWCWSWCQLWWKCNKWQWKKSFWLCSGSAPPFCELQLIASTIFVAYVGNSWLTCLIDATAFSGFQELWRKWRKVKKRVMVFILQHPHWKCDCKMILHWFHYSW